MKLITKIGIFLFPKEYKSLNEDLKNLENKIKDYELYENEVKEYEDLILLNKSRELELINRHNKKLINGLHRLIRKLDYEKIESKHIKNKFGKIVQQVEPKTISSQIRSKCKIISVKLKSQESFPIFSSMVQERKKLKLDNLSNKESLFLNFVKRFFSRTLKISILN